MNCPLDSWYDRLITKKYVIGVCKLSLEFLRKDDTTGAVHTLSNLVSNIWYNSETLFQNRRMLYNLSKLTNKDCLWHNGIGNFLFKLSIRQHSFAFCGFVTTQICILRTLFNVGALKSISYIKDRKGVSSDHRLSL